MTTLTISKTLVYRQVAQTTAYAGAKMGDYERMSATEADNSQLDRFWHESCDAISQAFRLLLAREERGADGLALQLRLSAAFDSALADSLQSAIFSYCVASIVAKWYGFVNKAEAPQYAAAAADMLAEAKRQAFSKRPPSRPCF